jgi:transcriptional regulator with XRE-family HTH domain
MPPRRLSRVIQRLREQKGLSQRELAAKVKVTPGYIAQLEQGLKTNPSLTVLRSLAKALGEPLAKLLPSPSPGEARRTMEEGKLDHVRRFLQKQFSALPWEQFDFERTAHRFTLEPGSNTSPTLIIPKETLDDADLAPLLDERLIEALKQARGRLVVLTSRGPRYSER